MVNGPLSEKAIRYLDLLAQGKSCKEASFEAGWALDTYKGMGVKIREALGARTMMQAMAIYTEWKCLRRCT